MNSFTGGDGRGFGAGGTKTWGGGFWKTLGAGGRIELVGGGEWGGVVLVLSLADLLWGDFGGDATEKTFSGTLCFSLGLLPLGNKSDMLSRASFAEVAGAGSTSILLVAVSN